MALHIAVEELAHPQFDTLEHGFLPFEVLFVIAIGARRGGHPGMTNETLLGLGEVVVRRN
jgi:hypothetical protein